jgi:hypothetical protein
MAIQNSIDFINHACNDNEFRALLNQVTSENVHGILIELGYDFTPFEFEESINLLHVKCQFEEQATQLHEIAMWYKILIS